MFMKIIPRQKPKLPPDVTRLFLDLLKEDKLLEGEHLGQFEHVFATYIGVKHAMLISSGRLALYILLKYFAIGQGDEVILPSYTCPIVPSIIVAADARPVFIDISPDDLNMNPDLIERSLTRHTKAVVATHIGGHPCDMARIIEIGRKHNIKIIEDCAQALGAEYNGKRVGSIGDVAYFSFATGKQINTMGGGIITTNDDTLDSYIREKVSSYLLPNKSSIIKKFMCMYTIHACMRPILFNVLVFPIIYLSNIFYKDIINVLFKDKGILAHFSDRPYEKYSNLQAAIGLCHFKSLVDENKKRIANSNILNTYLGASIARQKQMNGTTPIYLYYTLICNDRSQIKRRLLARGIDTQESWNVSCASLPLFTQYAIHCSVADRVAQEALYIPNYPSLNQDTMRSIARTVNNMVRA
jgi:dTDP-4-amino-4,6-dideoxygalactose transaminase